MEHQIKIELPADLEALLGATAKSQNKTIEALARELIEHELSLIAHDSVDLTKPADVCSFK